MERRKGRPGPLLLVPAVLSALWGGAVWGAQQSFTLPQAVAYALKNSGELNALRLERGIRDAGTVKAGLLPNPVLELEGATGALTGSSAENRVALGLSQEFLLGGKREKRLALAGRDLDLYRWQLAERERALAEEVKGAYNDLLLARERVTLAERSQALSRQLLEVTRERLAAGDIPELEMNLAKVEAGRSEGFRIESTRAMLVSRGRLAALMGLPRAEEAALSGRLDQPPQVTASLEELQGLARKSRPDLKALESELNRGEAEIAVARAEAVPNLTAGLVLGRDATSMEIGGVEGRDTAYTIGLRLSVPIPLFDRNQGALQEARARRDAGAERLSAGGRAVQREVDTAYQALRTADQVLALYKGEVLAQLEENLTLTQEAYRLGEVGVLAVIQEQKKFIEVSDGYLTALHDRQAAVVRLEAATACDLVGGDR